MWIWTIFQKECGQIGKFSQLEIHIMEKKHVDLDNFLEKVWRIHRYKEFTHEGGNNKSCGISGILCDGDSEVPKVPWSDVRRCVVSMIPSSAPKAAWQTPQKGSRN